VSRARGAALFTSVCCSIGFCLSLLAPSVLPMEAQEHSGDPPLMAPQENPDGQSTTGSAEFLRDLPEPKTTKYEVSGSVDYLLGQGKVVLPVFFSVSQLEPVFPAYTERPDRDSDYLGGTISFSSGQKWYFDLSYAEGESSGGIALSEFPGQSFPFTIDDTWYQAYVRYAFPDLRGKRLSAYLRLGFTYVDYSMRVSDPGNPLDNYSQSNDGSDKLGNLGFGVAYLLHAGTRTKWNLQLEGEGFCGVRDQKSQEYFGADAYPKTTFDNLLFGGRGRLTVRFEYGLGKTGLLKILADAGIQVKTTQIDYEDAGGRVSDLLWGPYAKVGLSYSF